MDPLLNRRRSDRYKGNRNYFRKPNELERSRGFWSLIAFVSVVGIVGLYLIGTSDGGQYQATHGPVTSPHAAWDSRCEACHKDQSEKTSFNGFNIFAAGERWYDMECLTCHAGPAHWKPTSDGYDASGVCWSCHHDHQGRNFSLVKLKDTDCTRCHNNLGEYSAHATLKYHSSLRNIAKEGEAFNNQITGFTKETHGEFRPLDEKHKLLYQQKRTLKFSHAVHMSAGVVYDRTGGRAQWKLNDILPEYQARYQPNAGPDGVIQLKCESCHVLDAGQGTNEYKNIIAALKGSGSSGVKSSKAPPEEAANVVSSDDVSLPPRSMGAYYLPIQFENHCKGCHALDTQLDPTRKSPRDELPHGLQPDHLEPFIKARISDYLLKSTGDASPTNKSERLDPREPLTEESKSKYRNEFETAIKKVNATLYTGTCARCHDTKMNQPEFKVSFDANGRPDRILRSSIPTVWFEHAKFSHVGHRAMQCVECHQEKYNSLPEKWDPKYEKEPIGIAGIDNCVQCHAPVGKSEKGDPLGGVRHACTDCHKYHNGEHPLQGLGASSRNPAPDKLLNTLQLMKGKQ